jgi:hypothetical protein
VMVVLARRFPVPAPPLSTDCEEPNTYTLEWLACAGKKTWGKAPGHLL